MARSASLRRPVNTVFQHYALFPHRTVAGNVAFGLEQNGCLDGARSRTGWRGPSRWCASPAIGERRIDQLSGGQKQRVALARALVLEPDVLLLDEPMAALDPKLRKEMQVEVKNLQERLGTTFVFVTHDQDEALVMSDRIAVMNGGRIEQVGTPEALYETPRTRFVADFLGGAEHPGRPRSRGRGRPRAAADARRAVVLAAPTTAAKPRRAAVSIGLRPERAAPRRRADARRRQLRQGRSEDEIYLGDWTDWRVRRGRRDRWPWRKGRRSARPRSAGTRYGSRPARGRPASRDSDGSRRGARRAGRRPRVLAAGLTLLLSCALLVLLFVLPQLLMFVASLGRRSAYGGVVPGGGLANYARALEPLYLGILGRSVVLAVVTTLLCLVVGWPVAYWLGRRELPLGEERAARPRDPALLDELPRADVRLDLPAAHARGS